MLKKLLESSGLSLGLVLSPLLLIPTSASAQHRHAQHGEATNRHCQTDYDHRPHYYHSGTHYHYCPGGAHVHGGGHNHGGKVYVSKYDPIVAEIQRKLEQGQFYDHAHHQVDGIFGPETAAAIRRYQQTGGLQITGQIDEALMIAMGIAAPQYGGAARNPATVANNGGDAAEILTPAEAAVILRVSEEDVIAVLQSGELAGNKIGNSWRVSRTAIKDYMTPKKTVEQQP